MRKIILVIASIVFLFSCSVTKKLKDTDMVGSYYAKIKGHNNTSVQYKLNLQPNIFSLNFKGQDYNSECTGSWLKNGDTLFLKCKEEKDIGILLSSGYMNQRDYTIKILSRNKLELDKVILIRHE